MDSKKLICDSTSYDECLKMYKSEGRSRSRNFIGRASFSKRSYKSFYPNKDYLNHKIVTLSLEFD